MDLKLKDHEYFLYKERTFPHLKNPWGWNYAVTSNFIKNNEFQSLGRFVGNLEEVLDFIDGNESEGNPVALLSNPFYRGEFGVEGSDEEKQVHQEKGVSKKVLKKAVGILNKKELQAYWEISDISLRYFAGEDKEI